MHHTIQAHQEVVIKTQTQTQAQTQIQIRKYIIYHLVKRRKVEYNVPQLFPRNVLHI